MTNEQKTTLIDKVKKKCYITDISKEITDRLTDIIDDGIIKISDKIGIVGDFDFSKPSKERDLLLNYCFYAWNDSANEFDINYLNDIMQIRQKYEVLQNADTETE